MTTATSTLDAVEKIDPAHVVVAGRYIDAIVQRDPLTALLGHDYATQQSERLWDRFIERYTDVASGAYAKHGKDALRVALSGL